MTAEFDEHDAHALLASVGLIIDWMPTQAREKLGRCPPGTPEADELALALALNCSRKMQTLFQLLAPVLRQALDDGTLPDRTRELAVRIKAENEGIDAMGQDYGAIAKRLEEIVRVQADEIHDEYRELLARAAGDETGA